MPKINIFKTDRPKCDHCGDNINGITYCEITFATNKVINMHRKCAVDLAVSILKESGKDKDLREMTYDRVIKLKNHIIENATPKEEVKEVYRAPSYIGVCECGDYEYWDIINYDTCCRCEHFDDNNMETRFECSSPYCVRRDGER